MPEPAAVVDPLPRFTNRYPPATTASAITMSTIRRIRPLLRTYWVRVVVAPVPVVTPVTVRAVEAGVCCTRSKSTRERW